MSNLKHISDDEEFNSHLKSVGDDLTVVDFYTTWCGPCKQMEPVLQSLSMKYPRVLFLKVDADKCFETAMKHDVKGVPLFIIYMNKTIVDQIAGAHPQELDRKLKQYEQLHRQTNPNFSNISTDLEMKSLSQVIASIGKVQDVSPFLEETECYCMNDLTPSAFDGFLGGKKLVSGKGSGKLVLVYSFKQKLMLHSFKIKAKVDTGPKVLRLFANHPKQIDFHLGTKVVPSQQIILLPEDLNGDRLIEFRTGNFTLVSNLQIFVTEPMTKGHRIEIESLTIFGAPVEMMKRPSKPNLAKITVAVAQSTSMASEDKNLVSTGTVPGTPAGLSSSPSTASSKQAHQSLSNTGPSSSTNQQPPSITTNKADPKSIESKWKNKLISQVDHYIDNAGLPAPSSKAELSPIQSNSTTGKGPNNIFIKSKPKTSSTIVTGHKSSVTSDLTVTTKKSSGGVHYTKSSKDKKSTVFNSKIPNSSLNKAKTPSVVASASEPRKGILRQTKPDPHANYHRVIADALANTTTTNAPTITPSEASESSSAAGINTNTTTGGKKRAKKRSSTNTSKSGTKAKTSRSSRTTNGNASSSTSGGAAGLPPSGAKSRKKRSQPATAPGETN